MVCDNSAPCMSLSLSRIGALAKGVNDLAYRQGCNKWIMMWHADRLHADLAVKNSANTGRAELQHQKVDSVESDCMMAN